jgi:hypothetical protein
MPRAAAAAAEKTDYLIENYSIFIIMGLTNHFSMGGAGIIHPGVGFEYGILSHCSKKDLTTGRLRIINNEHMFIIGEVNDMIRGYGR